VNHESVTAASEYHESESDNQQQQSETESELDKNVQNLEGSKRINFTKVPRNANGKKDKQAFRKDVEERRAFVAKEGKKVR
jgi:hypothetical protein